MKGNGGGFGGATCEGMKGEVVVKMGKGRRA